MGNQTTPDAIKKSEQRVKPATSRMCSANQHAPSPGEAQTAESTEHPESVTAPLRFDVTYSSGEHETFYGNAAYWNGYLYAGASNAALKQVSVPERLAERNPVAQSPTAYGLRGGHSVVSANGGTKRDRLDLRKSVSGGALMHAYDATQVSHELWNRGMNSGRDSMGTGIGFGTPGKVVVTADVTVTIYGLLN
jgi:hypothetical protein